jgi:hypothetical protein
MKVLKIAKWLTIGTIGAVLAACGGGGGSSDTLPPQSQLSIAGIKIGSYSYAENKSVATVKISSADRLDIFESIIPAISTSGNTNTFAGFGAILELPSDLVSGFATAQAIEISLAAEASPSAGPTRAIKVSLKKKGAEPNGCLPTATVQVPSTLTRFVLPLTQVQFTLPNNPCVPSATNPALAGVLIDIEAVQVEDGNIAATAVSSKFSIGKFAFTVVPPPPPPVASTPGTLIASFTNNDTNQTAQGVAIEGGYPYSGGGYSLTDPVKAIVGALLQWRSTLTITTPGGYAGSIAQINVPASTSNWSTATSITLQVQSDQSNYAFNVEIEAQNGCRYGADTPSTISPTLSTVTIALSSFTAAEACTAADTLATVLANVKQIRLGDKRWNDTQNNRNSDNRVGEIRILP